jgi:4-amino-4-deoxy-L-arabinose transferase-like glycosyltransferase
LRSKYILWAVLPLLYLTYFFGLTATGVLGPDEPRYAAIGRAMARSGDWITPRLWGSPWFEKPPLLYWMTAAATQLGLDTELAPRLPVVLISIAFLVFFWWILNREFGCRAAWLATLILGTSGMWIGYSQVGVTDIPMTAFFSAAMLCGAANLGCSRISAGSALSSVPAETARKGGRSQDWLPYAAALLGFAVLAKGLGPIVLAAPLLLTGRPILDWLKPRVLLPFFAITLPWYILCYWRNGQPFLHDFFVVHTFGRFASTSLAHGQPPWYYLPVMLAALLPWTPLLTLLPRRKHIDDPRRRFLLVWLLFTLLFFSVMLNKLPGYILPALPAAAALAGIALDEAPSARVLLTVCALLLAVFPIAAQVLPDAVLNGLSQAPKPYFHPLWLAPIAIAAIAWILDTRGRRLAATLTVAAGACLGVAYLKAVTAPVLDRQVSARSMWRQVALRADDVCLGDLRRDWVYGLNYYASRALPSCKNVPKPLAIVSLDGRMVAVDLPHPNVVTSPFRN